MSKKGQYERKDHLYHKAKEEGFRSRASYKLMELDKRFRLLYPGCRVLDLGAWPGGWIDVALKRVGSTGKVVGIDLVELDGFSTERVKLIVGDASDESILDQALASVGGSFDLVLSDMSPKLTGIKVADHAAAIGCSEIAFAAACRTLRAKANFATKVFKSNEAQEFYKTIKPYFEEIKRCELEATRKSSNEFYLVCFGFKKELLEKCQ